MMDRQWMGRMLSYAHKEKLWRRGSRILAAVSGGPDSLGLLLFLDSIREEEGIEVGCCCVDHHLRKESGEEADYVGKICLERKIPFYRRDVDVKGAQKGGESIETIARDLRYKALRDVKEKEHYDVIATAHHADDQAETVLFHFLRGSGAKGLSGISPKRDDLIRPFLCARKKEIEDFLKDFPYEPCHDPTNDIPDVTRNKLRLLLIPELLSYNPNLVETLSRTSGILREEDHFLEEEAKKAEKRIVKGEEGNCLYCDREIYRSLPTAIARRTTAGLMIRAGAKEPAFEGLERVRNLLLSGKTGAKTDEAGVTVDLSSNGFLVYAGDTRHEDKPDAWNLLQIIYKTICPKWVDNIHKTDIIGNNDTENCQKLGRWFMETRLLDKAPLHLEKYQYLLDADKVGTIRLRFPQKGDRIAPSGMEGTKDIGKLLQAKKVPKEARNLWPLAADEDHVYWAGFLRGSRYGRPSPDTKKFLLLTLSWIEGD